jgi:hypothetical protein
MKISKHISYCETCDIQKIIQSSVLDIYLTAHLNKYSYK